MTSWVFHVFWHVSPCAGSILSNKGKKALKNNYTKKKPIHFHPNLPSEKVWKKEKKKTLHVELHVDKASINKSFKYSLAADLLWYTNVFSGFSVCSNASGVSEQSSM